LPTLLPSFPLLCTSSPATVGFPPSVMTSTPARSQRWRMPEFKVYMTCKTQGWFLRWGCPRPSDAATSPGPGAAPGGAVSGAGAAAPARRPAPSASDDNERSDLITAGARLWSGAIINLELGDVAIQGLGVGHTPSKPETST
jgi:hypothetical protein